MNWYFTVLSKYAVFSGRARRKEFWYYTLFNIIFLIVLRLLWLFMGFPWLYFIYALGVLLPGLAVGVRRMHDSGRSGWFVIIPFVNLIFACMPGTIGPNEYGEDPKDGQLFGAADYEKPYDA